MSFASRECNSWSFPGVGHTTRRSYMGHTPSTAGTFQKKFRKDSGKNPETLSERFLEFPSRVRLGCPKPYNSRHLRLPEHFQNYLPPSTAGDPDASFFRKWFRRGPPRAGHGIPSSTGGISDYIPKRNQIMLCFPGSLHSMSPNTVVPGFLAISECNPQTL